MLEDVRHDVLFVMTFLLLPNTDSR